MHLKSFKLWVMFLLALLLASTVHAALEDLNLLYQQNDTQETMTWPMLPNETLAQLAAKFYPNNKIMQRKFIEKTKRLNASKLSPSTRYQKVTAITIPNLHALSAHAGVIKRVKKKAADKNLRLSYNIEPEQTPEFSIRSIPERLIRQYEELLVRNEFLKVELEKLNKRLEFLEHKLGQLELILDRTLSLPSAKKLKNLDAKPVTAEQGQPPAKAEMAETSVEQKKPVKQIAVTKKTQDSNQSASNKNKVETKHYLDFSNKLLWLGLALFGLLLVLGSHLINKYREKKYTKLVGAISQQKPSEKFESATPEVAPDTDALLKTTTPGPDTVVEEQSDQTVLQEAKAMMKKGSTEEAIGHLKWAIRAKPKISINTWLYLLDILRKQNLKDEFEKFAIEMHQNFNVMTPLWEEREVEIIVPQTLEDFPYIVKFLTEKWPNEKLNNYLRKLVADNRSGERSGFSKAVVEEIMLLIDVLELRGEVAQSDSV